MKSKVEEGGAKLPAATAGRESDFKSLIDDAGLRSCVDVAKDNPRGNERKVDASLKHRSEERKPFPSSLDTSSGSAPDKKQNENLQNLGRAYECLQTSLSPLSAEKPTELSVPPLPIEPQAHAETVSAPPVLPTQFNDIEDDEEADPGLKTLRSIDQAMANEICRLSPAQLKEAVQRDLTTDSLGTWMIWMVHRIALNDADVTTLNLTNLSMPTAEQEPRIVDKLVKAIGDNTHLTHLKLCNSSLQSGSAYELAESLSRNQTLEVLEVQCNFLTPGSLEAIFNGVAQNRNTAVKELRCSDQRCDQQADNTVFNAADQLLKKNFTLQKLGLDLPGATLAEQNFRDQIHKALIRNTEAARKKKKRQEEKIRMMEVRHGAVEGAVEKGGA